MTHEEFMHICLKIRKGDVTVDIPCCANCKYYNKYVSKIDETTHWICRSGNSFMQPEDFCSRWEARDG